MANSLRRAAPPTRTRIADFETDIYPPTQAAATVPSMSVDPDLELMLPARRENVAVARQVIRGLGEGLHLERATLDDIALAVTEACTNVVIHAYPAPEEGPLEVSATIEDDALTVVVRDRGSGPSPRSGVGVGLPLIASLTASLELCDARDGAHEVRMTFPLGEPRPRPRKARLRSV
jgi:anti-sigma regulatory factor (Ser/Thr protein kinase)